MPLLYFLIWLHCSMCHPCCDVGSFVVHELQVVLMVKNLPASAGDIPGLGRLDLWVGKIPGRGHGSPLQYSCLENPHGQSNLVATVHWVTKSQI